MGDPSSDSEYEMDDWTGWSDNTMPDLRRRESSSLFLNSIAGLSSNQPIDIDDNPEAEPEPSDSGSEPDGDGSLPPPGGSLPSNDDHSFSDNESNNDGQVSDSVEEEPEWSTQH